VHKLLAPREGAGGELSKRKKNKTKDGRKQARKECCE